MARPLALVCVCFWGGERTRAPPPPLPTTATPTPRFKYHTYTHGPHVTRTTRSPRNGGRRDRPRIATGVVDTSGATSTPRLRTPHFRVTLHIQSRDDVTKKRVHVPTAKTTRSHAGSAARSRGWTKLRVRRPPPPPRSTCGRPFRPSPYHHHQCRACRRPARKLPSGVKYSPRVCVGSRRTTRRRQPAPRRLRPMLSNF